MQVILLVTWLVYSLSPAVWFCPRLQLSLSHESSFPSVLHKYTPWGMTQVFREASASHTITAGLAVTQNKIESMGVCLVYVSLHAALSNTEFANWTIHLSLDFFIFLIWVIWNQMYYLKRITFPYIPFSPSLIPAGNTKLKLVFWNTVAGF